MDGQILTGTKTRTKQTPLYDSFSVAAAGAFAASGTQKMFGNIVGIGGIGPNITNMQKAFELPGANRFKVSALRVVAFAGAADIATMCQNFTVRFIASGITLLDAPPDFWPGGAGVVTSAANGINDPRAVMGFDLDPLQLEDGMNFRVEFVGTTFNAVAAMFIRVYLDGRWTEPI